MRLDIDPCPCLVVMNSSVIRLHDYHNFLLAHLNTVWFLDCWILASNCAVPMDLLYCPWCLKYKCSDCVVQEHLPNLHIFRLLRSGIHCNTGCPVVQHTLTTSWVYELWVMFSENSSCLCRQHLRSNMHANGACLRVGWINIHVFCFWFILNFEVLTCSSSD